MPVTGWTDQDWRTLEDRIVAGTVTPVLGAGASADVVGTAASLASSWAADIQYPFPDSHSLPAVAQYVATMVDRAGPGEYVQERLTERLRNVVVADLDEGHGPYRSLPTYPFRVWLTTNYDDLVRRALFSRNKPPKVTVARWTPPDLYWDKTEYDVGDHVPTEEHPLVCHLHGWYGDPASMVISESDYLEFLEQMSGPAAVLPDVVTKAIATTSLLFIGYSFRDTNLQLVLRQWTIPRLAYAVRPFPDGLTEGDRDRYADYYPRYLKKVTGVDFKVYWGTAAAFCAELDEHRGVKP